MNAAEFVDARKRLEISAPVLAIELRLTPHIVSAFEDGSLEIPKDVAAEMQWRLAARERQDALTASGLPECKWVQEWEQSPAPSKSKDLIKVVEAFNTHVATCANCRARDEFIQERFGAMPERPIPGWQGMVASVLKWVNRLPRPIQPAAKGALLFLAYSAFRLVFMLPRLAQTPYGWLMALGGLAASASVGAVVGSVFAGIRWLWKRSKHVPAT